MLYVTDELSRNTFLAMVSIGFCIDLVVFDLAPSKISFTTVHLHRRRVARTGSRSSKFLRLTMITESNIYL